MQDVMSRKHANFRRLMQGRLNAAFEALRLISQLSSKNYENTQLEAEEVVTHLDNMVHRIANDFNVPYASALGDAVSEVRRHGFGPGKAASGFALSEYDVIKAIELIRAAEGEQAVALLKAALTNQAR